MTRTFQTRLEAARQSGNLTVADLARWFEVPYQTVRSWAKNGNQPGLGPIDKAFIYARLEALEKAIRKRRGFPLPRLTGAARKSALLEARHTATRS